MFGTPQSSLEFCLLEQKLKGPGWLYIKNAAPHSPPTSWCKLEAVANDPYNVIPAEISDDIPPLCVMTMKIGNLIFKCQATFLSLCVLSCRSFILLCFLNNPSAYSTFKMRKIVVLPLRSQAKSYSLLS